MAKPAGGACNLDCSYCFYLDAVDLYPSGRLQMSDEVLEAYVEGMLTSRPGQAVDFTWQGGEPTLLGLDWYRRVVEVQRRLAPPGVAVRNSIQTNGTLLDDAWGAFLAEHRFLVGLSLDGPRELHDAFRHTKGGDGTYDRVVEGLRTLQRHGVDVNILTTVNSANVHRPLEVYDHLTAELGAQFLQFIPIVERAHDDVPSFETPSAQSYGRFLTAIFDRWVRSDVGRVFVRDFDNALAIRHGIGATICVHAETCGTAVALEHTGDLYACDHFVEPGHLVGSIVDTPIGDLVASPGQVAFGMAKRDTLTRYCRACDVLDFCGGGCPKDRFAITSDGERGLHHLCDGYRAFFGHVRPFVDEMDRLLRHGQPPSRIMEAADGFPPPIELPEPPPIPGPVEVRAGWTSLGMPRVRRRIGARVSPVEAP
jgi:uncharacterized protein